MNPENLMILTVHFPQHQRSKIVKKLKKDSTPERFELSRGNPMYLAGTRLNHSAKASLLCALEK
jgi:hypothetical protein